MRILTRQPLARSTPRWVTLIVVVAGAAAGCSGCFGNKTTEFPPGLEPLEENTAEPPPAVEGNPYPETFNVVQGNTDDTDWLHGRGYIHASVQQVWGAMKDPEVCVDRRKVDSWTVELNVEPDYEVSWRTRNTVNDIITVEFDVTWRQGLVEGTPEDPEVVGGAYQKTWGSTVIDYMAGSVVLRKVDESTTLFEFIHRLQALMSGAESVASQGPDLYASVLARVHGEPLPTY